MPFCGILDYNKGKVEKMLKKYISIDIGGTAIKYGIIDENGTILSRYEMKTEASKGGAAILQKTVNIVKELTAKLQKSAEFEMTGENNNKPAGICISTAGMVDIEKGEIFYSAPLIPEYAGMNFKKTMEEEFGLPCEVENDVNCAGLAEYVSGAAKGCQSSLMLTIGTGIGGSVVINGEVFRGFSGSACEVGYMHMNGSDFQTLGAASILTRKVSEWKNESAEEWNGYRIFEEAKKGDVLCNKAIDEMTDVLGQGIANICYVLNPEVVVLGGGIMAQEEFLKEKIQAAVEKYLVSGIAEHTKIAFAKHRNDAGMLGAYYHFCKMQER